MTTDPKDPWNTLVRPARIADVSALRFSPDGARNLFWALDADGNCLFLLRHAATDSPRRRLPKLRGLVVEVTPDPGSDAAFLVLRLIEPESRQLFHQLCLDIASATLPARTDAEAVERFLARTWRWHRLLSGGGDDRLSEEEQKGLIGELEVLVGDLLPRLGATGALEAWTGPFGAPKDFEIGRIAVEVKARRGAATPHVLITSEHQLDTSAVDALFLRIVEVATAADDGTEGTDLAGIVDRVRNALMTSDPAASGPFEERLAAVGFDPRHDYSDRRWIPGDSHLFEVRDGFPRITPGMHPGGIRELRYSISLPDCEPWRAGPGALGDALDRMGCYAGA